jgi:hypothetical protein
LENFNQVILLDFPTVEHGGTGTSSIAGLKDALDYTISGLDDVAVGFPNALLAEQILVWNGTAWINEYNDRITLRVRNNNEVAMSKGDVVAVESAQNANLINVILADASQTSAMPAIGILEQDLAVGEEGIAITFGKVQGVNTSGLAEGEIVYVSPTTPGGVTDIRPTHDHYFVQNIGIVMRTNTNNGVIKVTGVGRSNDIPNANITTASGDADYIYIDDGGVFKKITPTNLGVGSGGGGVTDHSGLSGLTVGNDHPQYLLSSTYSDVSGFFPSITRTPASNSNFSSLSQWTEGSGAIGTDWTYLTNNSTDAENIREYRPDPFNGSSICWVAIDSDTTNQSEGGPISDFVAIDASYDYRYSVWLKQAPSNGSSTVGSIYWGPRNYNAAFPENGLTQLDGSTLTTNHYFVVNDRLGVPSEIDGTYNDWYLFTGHIQASSTPVPSSNRSDSGVYNLSGVKVNDSYNGDVMFSSTCSSIAMRVMHWNNTAGTNDELLVWDPRIDKLDGNEPSIKDLLKLFHNRVPEVVPSVTEGGLSVTGLLPCPHPQPFWYGQTTADSTASRSYDWGSTATETEVVCDDHFNWDSANSRLYVSSTGVYEVDVMFMIDGGSDFTAEVIVNVDGTGKNTTTHDYVSANSPSEYSGRWVGKIEAGSYITATFRDAAVVVSTSHEAGSTMIVKRLA